MITKYIRLFDMDNLDRMGLIEIKSETQIKTYGGRIFWGLLGAAIYDCIANHETFTKSFKEGYKDHS